MESEKIMHKIDTEKIDASKIEPSVIKPIKLSENILTEPRIEEYETETPTLELTFKPISGPSVQLTQKPEQLPEVESNKITLISSEDASEFITKNFDIIKSMIQTEKGIRISEKLEELREKILEKIGFSIILHQISKWVGNLKKIKTKLPDSVKQELSDEIVNWVNKLIAKK